jgi:hypothetical protein
MSVPSVKRVSDRCTVERVRSIARSSLAFDSDHGLPFLALDNHLAGLSIP